MRDIDTYIVSSGCGEVNDVFMELLIMVFKLNIDCRLLLVGLHLLERLQLYYHVFLMQDSLIRHFQRELVQFQVKIYLE